jgi:hypothetical protein
MGLPVTAKLAGINEKSTFQFLLSLFIASTTTWKKMFVAHEFILSS